MAHITSRKHAVARSLPFLGSSAAALFVLGQPAMAQSVPGSLREVRIEAPAESVAKEFKTDESANPKFTAPLLDIPQVVQVIPEALIRQQGVTTLSEALRNSPGVGAFFLGENGNTTTGDAIYMRGFDASSSIFVDGVRDLGAITRDVFNLEQIEVVKGPSGTDVGRSSPTGYINLMTKKPDLQNSFSGTVGFGSADLKRGTIDWNRVIGAIDGSATAFRLNAVSEDGGVAGRDMVKNKRWAVAPSLAFGLNTPTRVFLDYVHVKQNNVPDGGVPTIGLPGYGNPDALSLGKRRRGFIDIARTVDPSNFYGTSSDFNDVTADMLTARIEHDLTPDMTLRNVTRYGRTAQDYMLTSFMLGGLATPAGAVPAVNEPFLATPNPDDPASWSVRRNLPTNKDQRNTIVLNQTSLTSRFATGGFGHTMNIGLELLREQQQTQNYFGQGFATVESTFAPSGAWPAANLYAPNPYVSGYRRFANGTGSSGRTDTVSLYAFDTLKINEQWQLTGGLRWDHYSSHFDASTLKLPFKLSASNLSASGDLWSGKLGVVYKPAPNGSIYAAFGTSAQPPGGANFSLAASGTGNSASRVDFKPQEAKSYEIGTKWDVANKKLALTAALYRTEVENEIKQDPTNPAVYTQDAKKHVQGIELGAAGAITDRWGISAGFVTMNSAVDGSANRLDTIRVVTYSPKRAFTAWTSYELPFGLTLGGGARYNGKLTRGYDGAVGTPAYTKAYWVFDAMVSYRVNKNVDLQLNVYNLFDKQYVASINKSGYRYLPGVERSALLSANFRF